MAISDSAKVDLLYKKFFGVAKTDTPANKSASNESIASPALVRADKAWVYADYIPSTPPSTTDSYVKVYTGASRIECTPDTSSTPIGSPSVYPTWKTSLTNWIPPEFGSGYFVKVYIAPTGTSGGTQISDSGSGGVGEWLFDYQSGVLNFIGGTIPSYLAANPNYKVFIEGYRYINGVGVSTFANADTVNTLVSRNSLNGFNSGRITNYNGASFEVTGGNNVKIQTYSAAGYTGYLTVTNAAAPNNYAVYTLSSGGNLYIGMKVHVSGVSGGTSYGSYTQTTNTMTITAINGNVVTTDNPITASGTPTYSSASMYNAPSDIYNNSFEIARDSTIVLGVSSGQISLGNGGTALKFTNSTSNRISFSTSGVAGPTLSSYSNGVKIVMYDNVSGSLTGYTMGIEANNMWFGVDTSASGFKWYAGTTRIASLSGAGVLTVENTATGVAPNVPGGNFSIGLTGKYWAATSSTTGRIYFPSSNTIGREITIVSTSSSSLALSSYNASFTTPVTNIYARGSTTLGSTIANASIGSWATLVCVDGTNWQVVASSA